MALVNCKECGKEVSTEAKSCPNCGASQPKKSVWPKVVMVIVITASLFMVAGVYAGHRLSSEATNAVKARLDRAGVRVSISKYRKSTDREYDYVCGMAHYYEAGGKEKSVLFFVTEQGIFPSVVATQIDGDSDFGSQYTNVCG